jgi:hypothetical protein
MHGKRLGRQQLNKHISRLQETGLACLRACPPSRSSWSPCLVPTLLPHRSLHLPLPLPLPPSPLPLGHEYGHEYFGTAPVPNALLPARTAEWRTDHKLFPPFRFPPLFELSPRHPETTSLPTQRNNPFVLPCYREERDHLPNHPAGLIPYLSLQNPNQKLSG